MFKVLYQKLSGTLTTAFEKHLLTIEGLTGMGVEPAPRDLTYYFMLILFSNELSF